MRGESPLPAFRKGAQAARKQGDAKFSDRLHQVESLRIA